MTGTAHWHAVEQARDEALNLADVAVGWCSPKAKGNEKLILQMLERHDAALAVLEELAEAAEQWLSETGPGQHINSAKGRGMTQRAIEAVRAGAGHEQEATE